MKKHINIKEILASGFAVALVALSFSSCDHPHRDELDSEAGTSKAIVGERNRLNEPRPGPIGDTSKTPEQRNRFGDLKSNQDSTARGLR